MAMNDTKGVAENTSIISKLLTLRMMQIKASIAGGKGAAATFYNGILPPFLFTCIVFTCKVTTLPTIETKI